MAQCFPADGQADRLVLHLRQIKRSDVPQNGSITDKETAKLALKTSAVANEATLEYYIEFFYFLRPTQNID